MSNKMRVVLWVFITLSWGFVEMLALDAYKLAWNRNDPVAAWIFSGLMVWMAMVWYGFCKFNYRTIMNSQIKTKPKMYQGKIEI